YGLRPQHYMVASRRTRPRNNTRRFAANNSGFSQTRLRPFPRCPAFFWTSNSDIGIVDGMVFVSKRKGETPSHFMLWRDTGVYIRFCETNPFYFRVLFDVSLLFIATSVVCSGVCKWVRFRKT